MSNMARETDFESSRREVPTLPKFEGVGSKLFFAGGQQPSADALSEKGLRSIAKVDGGPTGALKASLRVIGKWPVQEEFEELVDGQIAEALAVAETQPWAKAPGGYTPEALVAIREATSGIDRVPLVVVTNAAEQLFRASQPQMAEYAARLLVQREVS